MAQRNWSLVILGLLISSFLGGAVRVFFSPERVRAIAVKLLNEREPKFDIEFAEAKLQLADSWWPSLAVELSQIDVKAKDPCITNSSIHIDQIVVPFQLSTILSKRKKLGHVRANEMRFFIRSSSCPNNEISDSRVDEFASLERFFQKRWSKEVVNTTRYLDEFSIQTLILLRDDEVLAPATIRELRMRFLPERGESEANFYVELGSPWVGPAEFGWIETKAVIRSESVTAQGHGNLKEGQFQLQSEWAVGRGDISLRLLSRDMPTQSVLSVIHHWGFIQDLKPNLKNQWMNCDVSINGRIRDFIDLPIELHQCRLYGDLGDMTIKTQKIKSVRSGGELVLQIQNLDVKKVLSDLGLKNHWSYISQLGFFSGDLKVLSPTSYVLAGDIHGSEIYIVNSKGQVKQKFERFVLQLLYENQRFTGIADRFLIPNGAAFGTIDFSMTPEGTGYYKLNIKQLQLPVPLQKILWDGVLKNAKIEGRGELQEAQVMRFEGDLLADEFQTQHWQATPVKLRIEYAKNLWNLNGQSKKFSIKPESHFVPLFNGLMLFLDQDARQKVTEPAFLNAAGSIQILQDYTVKWDQVKATALDQRSNLVFQGQWSKEDDLDGRIQMQYKKKKKSWLLYGDIRKPQIKEMVVE